jgi:hypothetical protein
MKKHIEALEKRREYLVRRLENDHPAYGTILDGTLLAEKEALDWALGKLEADPEPVEIDIYTGEIVARNGRLVKPIGTSGHYGPIRVGETVQAKVDVKYAGINMGEIGKLTKFDSWVGEEYPYIATFEGGRSAAFPREELRRVD